MILLRSKETFNRENNQDMYFRRTNNTNIDIKLKHITFSKYYIKDCINYIHQMVVVTIHLSIKDFTKKTHDEFTKNIFMIK